MRSLLVAALVVAGCSKAAAPPEVPPGLVRVSDDSVVVRTSTIGAGPEQYVDWHQVEQGESFTTSATYVLVDAQNISDHDLLITLGGDLTDAGGGKVAPLRPESLRMPKGASRTFVLVDDAQQARPTATGARVYARGAVQPTWTPTMALADGHALDDQGTVVVAASVHNQADRRGQVMVLAGFHDAAGKPVARQFDVVDLEADETRVVRFFGPKGASTGAIWLGDSTY